MPPVPRFPQTLGAILAALLLSHCASQRPQPRTRPAEFHVSPEYDLASATETKISVDLSEQKARLLGRDGKVLVETLVSTGMPSHPSPTGVFRVLEKLEDKRSNRYGSYIDPRTGEVLAPKTWEHKGPRPPGSAFLGWPMPFWMRLTWTGVGMHVGEGVMGQTGSHGCIRVPKEVMPLIFRKCLVGTPVTISS